MKIKLDENIPLRVIGLLTALGHDVDTVLDEGLLGRNDGLVWQAAQSDKRFLITQDLDFSDLRRFAPQTHHGLLLIRLHQPGRLAVAKRIEQVFQTKNVTTWAKCFVVATDRKIRVRR